MQLKILAIIIAAGLIISSCNNKVVKASGGSKPGKENKTETVLNDDIPYTVANRYFARNDFRKQDFTAKITSKPAFEKFFGAAPVMGPKGKPTAIDFSKQYVVGVVGELTDHNTEIVPVSLRQKAGTIVFTYKIKEGEKTMATIQPMLLIVVDNKYQGEIRLVDSRDKN